MNNTLKMILTLSFIGVISGGLLSLISAWAEPQIEAHRKEETQKAVFLVQPNASDYRKIDSLDFEAYRVFDEDGKPLGFSVPFEGNGFQGKIRLMVGLKNDLNEITGLEILEQVETPGLGTKITEGDFREQFSTLRTLPKIEWVKGKAPSNVNEIQTITGATISSKSVVAIINAGIEKLRAALEEKN